MNPQNSPDHAAAAEAAGAQHHAVAVAAALEMADTFAQYGHRPDAPLPIDPVPSLLVLAGEVRRLRDEATAMAEVVVSAVGAPPACPGNRVTVRF